MTKIFVTLGKSSAILSQLLFEGAWKHHDTIEIMVHLPLLRSSFQQNSL